MLPTHLERLDVYREQLKGSETMRNASETELKCPAHGDCKNGLSMEVMLFSFFFENIEDKLSKYESIENPLIVYNELMRKLPENKLINGSRDAKDYFFVSSKRSGLNLFRELKERMSTFPIFIRNLLHKFENFKTSLEISEQMKKEIKFIKANFENKEVSGLPYELQKEDAELFVQVYKLQDRPFEEDLLLKSDSQSKDNVLVDRFLNFQLKLCKIAEAELVRCPHLSNYALQVMQEIFVIVDGKVIPNPRLIRVFCNNVMPCITLLGGINEIGDKLSDTVRKSGLYQSYIVEFRENELGKVNVAGVTSQVCPAIKLFSDSLKYF